VGANAIKVACCIAGGGPAGMMLGFLLARAGVRVTVLETHADFLRDFRGDTIHPSTLELMYELGLLEKFLSIPHDEINRLTGLVGDDRITIADFAHVPTRCKFVALMPQWDFLNFIADHAKRYSAFDLRMRTEADGLIEENGRVVGLRAKAPGGPLEIRADLVAACDGRHSILREQAGLQVDEIGAPIDVLWFRVSRRPSDTAETFGHLEAGRMMVMLNRRDYWQCAYVIAKGGIESIKQKDLQDFRENVAAMAPFLHDRIAEIRSWDDIKLLTVAIDRLRQWYRPGLICLGDAAHAMSPVGGVGINLAIQDAVAAANILAKPLREGDLTVTTLRNIQKRREFPTRVTQRLQVLVQSNVINPVLKSTQRPKAPLAAKLLRWVPVLQRIPAWLVGVGIRPEHVRTPDATVPPL
jgi:2-polyprenyl-6-methoxyphenol hydroxylase-like FAD-dependent oxidoreductase